MKYILLLAVVASTICTALSVRCYQCESLTNPRCGKEFHGDENMKYNCDGIAPPRFLQSFLPIRNATGCMKKSLESVAGHPQIIRTCYFGDVAHKESGCTPDPSLPFIKELSCEVCTGDYCNSSSTFGPLAFVTLLTVALTRFIF